MVNNQLFREKNMYVSIYISIYAYKFITNITDMKHVEHTVWFSETALIDVGWILIFVVNLWLHSAMIWEIQMRNNACYYLIQQSC